MISSGPTSSWHWRSHDPPSFRAAGGFLLRRQSRDRSRPGRRPSARLGDGEERTRLRARRHADRRAARLDLRRHVLDLRHPGPRGEEEGRVHPRGARAARQGQRRVAQGIRLLHLRDRERQEGRVQRAGRRLLSGLRSEGDRADAALRAAAEVAGEGEGLQHRGLSTANISSTSASPKRIRSSSSARPRSASSRSASRRRWAPR